MSNKEIVRQLRLLVSLLEMHEADPAEVKPYSSAIFQLEKTEAPVAEMNEQALREAGFRSGMAQILQTIGLTGTFPALEERLAQTPPGVVELLSLKGLGGKKVGTLWKELGIENIQALLEAARQGKIAQVKGFGEKTQAQIIEQIEFLRANASRLHFADAEPYALRLRDWLTEQLPGTPVQIVGQVGRCAEVVDRIELLVGNPHLHLIEELLAGLPEVSFLPASSGPFTWQGLINERSLPLTLHLCRPERMGSDALLLSAAGGHLARPTPEGRSLYQLAVAENFEQEAALYERAGLPHIPAELREDMAEWRAVEQKTLSGLVQNSDLKGILHNHSTYSDGRHTLRQMAEHCKALGYQYLGMADHSQSAFYANGLTAERVRRQQEEIDELNAELAPFRILKGIESDILADGRLDYPDEVLATFDFVVASVHSGLRMDVAKATDRLLRAIENPFTTILGHLTGRLLLRREGYPLDMPTVLEACAQYGVVVELNANPWRLDIDWRWLPAVLEKGLLVSINPDAHEMEGYADMRYGVLAARKGGLTAAHTFNALPLESMMAYLQARREKAMRTVIPK